MSDANATRKFKMKWMIWDSRLHKQVVSWGWRVVSRRYTLVGTVKQTNWARWNDQTRSRIPALATSVGQWPQESKSLSDRKSGRNHTGRGIIREGSTWRGDRANARAAVISSNSKYTVFVNPLCCRSRLRVRAYFISVPDVMVNGKRFADKSATIASTQEN
jgi:hypothetical protein